MGKGIFDPWRQSTPAPAAKKDLRAPPKPVEEYDQDAEEVEKVCVAFRGTRAGVNIWIDPTALSPDEYVTVAQYKLVDVVFELRPTQEDFLMRRGVSFDPNMPGLAISDETRTFVVGVEAQDDQLMKRGVDTLSMALRAVINEEPAAAKIIRDAGIKPFVK